MNYVVSFSGGKDSTAMLLKLLEERYPIDYIVFADTGVEFPQMYKHIDKVNNYISKYYGKEITKIQAKYDFIYYATEYKKTKGNNKGKPYGFPSWNIRWCTTLLKINPIKNFLKNKKPYTEYIAYAFDEQKRVREDKKYLYPLIKWGMTEQDCLNYCYERGFDWGGLYNYFNRLSCWICPFKSKNEMKTIMTKFPELWNEIKRISIKLKKMNVHGYKFAKKDMNELEKWVKGEEK